MEDRIAEVAAEVVAERSPRPDAELKWDESKPHGERSRDPRGMQAATPADTLEYIPTARGEDYEPPGPDVQARLSWRSRVGGA